jgi:hypothetical protein
MRGASAGWEARATAGQETGATFHPLLNHAVTELGKLWIWAVQVRSRVAVFDQENEQDNGPNERD